MSLRIEPYRPEWREHFQRLNTAWIEKHFVMEPVDLRFLVDPEAAIIAAGGCIFFALSEERVIGTCALEPHGDGRYELIKMGVEEGSQRLGAGRALVERAIAEFQRLGGTELFLETNSKLAAAIRLYERVGFIKQSNPRGSSDYIRADVYMVYASDTTVSVR